jgi:hypothetical protein
LLAKKELITEVVYIAARNCGYNESIQEEDSSWVKSLALSDTLLE